MAFEYQGDVTHAKPDTLALIDVGTSATADVSQAGSNWTSTANGAYSSNTALNVAGAPCEITCQFDATSAQDKTLVYLGDSDASHFIQLRVESGGAGIALRYNTGAGNTILISAALPNLAAGARTYTAQWCIRDNPLSTGGSDAFLTELTIIDHDTADSYHIEQATHADLTPTISGTFYACYGMWWDGASENDVFSGSIAWVRIGVRFHSTTEAVEEWVSATTPGTIDGDERVELLPLPQAAGNWADDKEFAGKQLAYAAAANRDNSLRLSSNALTLRVLEDVANEDDLTDVYPAGWIMDDPGDNGNGWQVCLAFAAWLPVAETCNRYQVYLTKTLYDTTTTPKQLEVRVYSSNAPPGALVNQNTLERRRVTLTTSVDDTSTGPPTRHDLGLLPISRMTHGGISGTFIYLAFRVNSGTADATTRYKIHDLTLDPVTVLPASDEPHQNEIEMGG